MCVCVCVHHFVWYRCFCVTMIKANIFPHWNLLTALASVPFTFSSIVSNYLSSSLAQIRSSLKPHSRLNGASLCDNLAPEKDQELREQCRRFTGKYSSKWYVCDRSRTARVVRALTQFSSRKNVVFWFVKLVTMSGQTFDQSCGLPKTQWLSKWGSRPPSGFWNIVLESTFHSGCWD